MHQTTEDEGCGKNAHRNVPCDDLLPKHVDQAKQQCQGAHLTGSTGTECVTQIAEEHIKSTWQLVEHAGVAGFDGFLHECQWSGLGGSVGIAHQLSFNRP